MAYACICHFFVVPLHGFLKKKAYETRDHDDTIVRMRRRTVCD